MAENIVLNSVTTFQNDTTAVNTVNGNNTTITNAFVDCLSRSGTSPNQMQNNLDMNNNQILNLPPPGSINSPARLVDVVSNPTITVPPTGTSGAVVGLLNGNNTYSGTSNFTNTVTLPNNNITRTNLAQGVARSVIGVTGNVTANVADIQGTTRQVLAVNTAGTALAFAQPQGDQLLGTTTNDSASTGNIGEFVTANIGSGSAITLSTNTAANITSISLTAGDWDVWGTAYFVTAATTSITVLQSSISTTSATLNVNPGNFSIFSIAANVPNVNTNSIDINPTKISLASTTTVFLVAQATFTVAGLTGYGIIQARRVR